MQEFYKHHELWLAKEPAVNLSKGGIMKLSFTNYLLG